MLALHKTNQSDATCVEEIIEELRSGKLRNVAERSAVSRIKDGGLETLKRRVHVK